MTKTSTGIEKFGYILGGIGAMTFIGSFFLMHDRAEAYGAAPVCAQAETERGDSSSCRLRTKGELLTRSEPSGGGSRLSVRTARAGKDETWTLDVYTDHLMERFRPGQSYVLELFQNAPTGIQDLDGAFVPAATNPKSSPRTLRYASLACMALGLIALISRMVRRRS